MNTENIQVYLSDKASPYYAPYSTNEQRANVDLMKSWVDREYLGGYDYAEAKSYFIAGGGDENKFDVTWKSSITDSKAVVKAFQDLTFHMAGGGIFYLVSANKPLAKLKR